MISKILFTAAIVIAVLLLMRTAGGRDKGKTLPPPGSAPARPRNTRGPLIIAAAIATVMVALTAYVVFSDMAEDQREVTVRVINTRTGESTDYRAERGAIRGRTFHTLDGRTVTVADVERIELIDPR
ncbi:MAG: antitermination protein NusG [Gammaproteobacteria bacterium]